MSASTTKAKGKGNCDGKKQNCFVNLMKGYSDQTQRPCKDQGKSDTWRISSNLISENLISDNYRTLNQLLLKLSKEKDWTTESGV